MAGNKNLNSAAHAKNDEFYTQYDDIQRELNCYYLYDKNFLRGKTILLPCDDPEWSNFTKFFVDNFKLYGLKKLISTGYAAKDFSHVRIYTLEADDIAKVDYPLDALRNWRYLEGDGDFRANEVKRLRDEADVIITNPPFSLFRDFLAWIVDARKKFLIIGNINVITYKEVFPLIMQDKLWLGNGFKGGDPCFKVPDDYEERSTRFWIDEHGQKWRSFGNLHWFTNLEHGRRHERIELFRRYAEEPELFPHYDNYDAIEVRKAAEIPIDYCGVMGVPITFLDKYCPEQFEIVGCTYVYGDFGGHVDGTAWGAKIGGKDIYKRLFIRQR